MIANPILEKLRTIVTPAHVCAAAQEDALVGVTPRIIIEPANEQELAAALKIADDVGLAVIPRGGGTKLEWGNPPVRADIILSTRRLHRITEHAWSDLTVTVEAGCTMQTLQMALAEHGQRLALDALWPGCATVGGVLSANDSGILRLRFGSLRDLIIGVTLALPDGTLAKSGGKVVKNVAGYDLPKLATGALGTLGVITQAVFRLHPVPLISRSLTMAALDLNDAQRILHLIQDSKLAHCALQARFSSYAPPELDILFEGTEAGLAAQQLHAGNLVEPARAMEASSTVWNAREDLWPDLSPDKSTANPSMIAKLSVLPSAISATIQKLAQTAALYRLQWKAVVQATGIGWVRIDGAGSELAALARSLREEIEGDGGSMVLMHRDGAEALMKLDAWGTCGDALPLMRAVKHQLDPKETLNPGRYLGGI